MSAVGAVADSTILLLERTFLAWLRTSLAFASIGIAITQLFRLNAAISDTEGRIPSPQQPTTTLRQVGKPLGATFLGIAILVLGVGWRRYFESQVCLKVLVFKTLESCSCSSICQIIRSSHSSACRFSSHLESH